MNFNFKNRKFQYLVVLLLTLCIIASGCGFFTKQYKSKETGKLISENLTKVFQLGVAVKSLYDVFVIIKPDVCNTSLLNTEQCELYDMGLRKMNAVLQIYSKTAGYWYDLEIKPEGSLCLDTESAIEILAQLLNDKDQLLSSISELLNKKITIPKMPDFSIFTEFVIDNASKKSSNSVKALVLRYNKDPMRKSAIKNENVIVDEYKISEEDYNEYVRIIENLRTKK